MRNVVLLLVTLMLGGLMACSVLPGNSNGPNASADNGAALTKDQGQSGGLSRP